MKKVFQLIIIIGIPTLLYFQYKSYIRFHPPVDYDYKIPTGIDANYHNSILVKSYFEGTNEIGAFARKMWFNESIDVRFPDVSNEESINASALYNTLLNQVRLQEAKLINSYNLKLQNITNDQIKLIEETGVNPSLLNFLEDKDRYLGLSEGTRGALVWELQKMLIEKGFNLQKDGVYSLETRTQIMAFQNANDLYPSGRLNAMTFDKLFLNR